MMKLKMNSFLTFALCSSTIVDAHSAVLHLLSWATWEEKRAEGSLRVRWSSQQAHNSHNGPWGPISLLPQ